MFKIVLLAAVALLVLASVASAQYYYGAGYYPTAYSTYGGYYGVPSYGYASYGVPAVYYKK